MAFSHLQVQRNQLGVGGRRKYDTDWAWSDTNGKLVDHGHCMIHFLLSFLVTQENGLINLESSLGKLKTNPGLVGHMFNIFFV